MLVVLLLAAVLPWVGGVPTDVHVSALSPRGIQFKLKDFPGLEMVGFHYNINHELRGSSAASNNYDTHSKSADGYWYHRNTNVAVRLGDTVHYWLFLQVYGVGQVATELTATVEGSNGGTSSGSTGSGSTSSGSTSSGSTSRVAVTTPGPQTSPHQNTGMRTLFYDDFSGTGIDPSKWKHEVSAFGGGNWEFQIYSPDPKNSYVKNGVLYLLPTLTSDTFGEDFLFHGVLDVRQQWGVCTQSMAYGCHRDSKDAIIPPIMSAKVITQETYSFKYGRVEVEAKMPIGDWTWPAIWLMPRDSHYGGWPVSGEIDMVETRGNRNYGDIGIQRMMSTLHWGPSPAQDSWGRTTQHRDLGSGTWGDDFHRYSMDWTRDHIILSVDGHPVLTAPTPPGGYFQKGGFSGTNPWQNGGQDAPFDREFYFQMNTAVGGTNGFFPDNIQNGGYAKPWSNSDPLAPKRFYEARHLWMPTWHGEDPALKVRSVRIMTYD